MVSLQTSEELSFLGKADLVCSAIATFKDIIPLSEPRVIHYFLKQVITLTVRFST